MRIENTMVNGLANSFRVSKFPMLAHTELATEEYTPTIAKLAGCRTGEGHDNFLKGCIVQADVTATNKWWIEAQRYHWFDIVSAQSTMHRMAKFDLRKAYNEHVDPEIVKIMCELQARYEQTHSKDDYLRLLYSNPAGMELTNGITTNYQQLKTMYHQRKNHTLPEWHTFCGWVQELPYSWLITGEEGAK